MVREVGNRERILWISLVTVILAVLTLVLVNGEREKAAWGREEANLQGRISELTSELAARTERYTRQVVAFPGNNTNIMNSLAEQGFEGGVQDIVDDLIKHPELIPYEGVLGGRMGFWTRSMFLRINGLVPILTTGTSVGPCCSAISLITGLSVGR
ncbi:hypothetical protein [Desulfosporosinus youngiae]|uniref:Uncharacterized protein n=1 Tax=Desulfosporosinus youngiae DSM 17734 TaxID=768710 RepID=H5Y2E9_9FIRM|nr:hypothetical protein [Desulfosporosinus youngiae]EHQ88640.1 hypothetical protein DesyoDRAFT_1489 [Desulfosporosinus youngiae DSM 17734]